MQRKSLLVLFFKIFVLAGVFAQGVYLYLYKPDLMTGVLSIFNDEINYKLIVCTLLLMFLNWSLEAYKWQYVIKWVKFLPFIESLKTVLLGLAFSFFTPRGIGEYFARAYTLDVERKLPIVLSLLLARMSQLLVLIFGGIFGGVLIMDKDINPNNYVKFELDYFYVGIAAAFLSLIVVLYLFVKFKLKIHQILKLLKKSDLLSFRTLIGVTGLSFVRYCTYCSQFVLLVFAFGVENVSLIQVFGAVMFTFLMKSLVPVFNFMSDLGVREVFSVIFLSLVGVPAEVALSASLLLWFINIIFPTVVGSLLVFKTRITW